MTDKRVGVSKGAYGITAALLRLHEVMKTGTGSSPARRGVGCDRWCGVPITFTTCSNCWRTPVPTVGWWWVRAYVERVDVKEEPRPTQAPAWVPDQVRQGEAGEARGRLTLTPTLSDGRGGFARVSYGWDRSQPAQSHRMPFTSALNGTTTVHPRLGAFWATPRVLQQNWPFDDANKR